MSTLFLKNAGFAVFAFQFFLVTAFAQNALDDISMPASPDGYIWGVKSHDPVSNPPSTLFKFTPAGSFTAVGTVTLDGAPVDVDGMAINAAGQFYAFQVTSGGTSSRLIQIDPNTAEAEAIGLTLTNRDIRGACFDHLGRLLVIDAALDQFLQVDPATGQILKTIYQFPSMSNCCDITQQRDGTFMVAEIASFYRLTVLRDASVYCKFYDDPANGQENRAINMAGLAAAGFGSDPDLLYMYDVGEEDDIYTYRYTYDPGAKMSRQTLVADLISGYNAGRGDLACAPAALLDAYPVTSWNTNGHRYQTIRVLGGIDWFEARDVAAARGGHLATIHSQAENDFCYDLINDDPSLWFINVWGDGIGPWIGGYELGEGIWFWTTGEPWSFAAWASGEPNNLGGHEAYAHFFSNRGTLMNNTWNDVGAYVLIHGYLTEWEITIGPYNMNHLAQMSGTWQASQNDLNFNPDWDLNPDGQIDFSDLANFAADWLE